MKIRTWTLVPLAVACCQSAYANCREDISAMAPRLATSASASADASDPEAMRQAFSLLSSANALCERGDEGGASSALAELESLLKSIGR